MLINKTDRENKKAERTFNINLMDLLNNVIDKIELVNIDDLSAKDDPFVNEHHFNVTTSYEHTEQIQWGYFTIPLNKLEILYDKNKIVNYKEIEYIDTGDCLHFTPGCIFNEEQRKQLQQNQEVIVVVATLNKSLIFPTSSKGCNFYIINPDKKPIVNKLQLSEKYTSYYGRSLHVTNIDKNVKYQYNKEPALALKGKPEDENIRKIYTFGIKIDVENYDENFNHFSYGIVGLKWLKINVMTSYKAGKTDEEKKEKESSLQNTCKEILNKYKNNPLDIDFASLSKNNIEVTGNVSIITAYNSTKTSACKLIEDKYQGTIIYNEDENIYYYVLNKGEQEGAVILCPFIDKPVLEEGKYIQLGFNAEDVANYMAREIENNLNSKPAQELKSILQQYDSASSLFIKNMFSNSNKVIIDYEDKNDDADIYWNNRVKSNSIWDHKWQLSALFPSMGLSRRYHHIYNDIEIFYDAWSNIHFGVIGTYVGYSKEKLLNGAGYAQKISNQHFIGTKMIYAGIGYYTNYANGAKYDNDIDSYLISNGIELYLTKNINISSQDLLNSVSNIYKGLKK